MAETILAEIHRLLASVVSKIYLVRLQNILDAQGFLGVGTAVAAFWVHVLIMFEGLFDQKFYVFLILLKILLFQFFDFLLLE